MCPPPRNRMTITDYLIDVFRKNPDLVKSLNSWADRREQARQDQMDWLDWVGA